MTAQKTTNKEYQEVMRDFWAKNSRKPLIDDAEFLNAIADVAVKKHIKAQPPKLNQPWPEQGGIFVGTRLIDGVEHHVVIPGGAEHDIKDVKFEDAAAAIPKEINGHADWRMPEKEDLQLAYINSRERFERKGMDSIYWSSTEEDEYWVWAVVFMNGRTDNNGLGYKLRVRPFRSFPAE